MTSKRIITISLLCTNVTINVLLLTLVTFNMVIGIAVVAAYNLSYIGMGSNLAVRLRFYKDFVSQYAYKMSLAVSMCTLVLAGGSVLL